MVLTILSHLCLLSQRMVNSVLTTVFCLSAILCICMHKDSPHMVNRCLRKPKVQQIIQVKNHVQFYKQLTTVSLQCKANMMLAFSILISNFFILNITTKGVNIEKGGVFNLMIQFAKVAYSTFITQPNALPPNNLQYPALLA